MYIKLLISALISVASTTSIAGSVNIDGINVNTVVPPKHCELGTHPREVAFINQYKLSQARNSRLVSMFAACDELENFRKERIDSFRQFGVILRFSVIPNGNRRDYVAYMCGEGAPAIAEGFKVGSDRVAKYIGPIGDSKLLGVVAQDASACYIGTLMTAADERGNPRTLLSVAGATFVKQMSFSIQYAEQYSGSPPLASVIEIQKRTLASFVAANDR